MHNIRGYFYTLTAFFLWGFQPLYWKQLIHVSPLELLAHRILWSFFLVGILYVLTRPDPIRKVFSDRNILFLVAGTAFLIAVNWFLYIFAVFNDHIVEASLGYYINPLMNILLGRLFLKERLKPIQRIALLLSTTGVLYFAFDYGRFPWIALTLATAFGFYGLLKKLTPLDSLSGLLFETAVLLPWALSYIGQKELHAQGALGLYGTSTTTLLILGGIVTSLPLYLFGKGARLIPLSTVGFFQYIAPSMMLLLGVLIYHEPFTKAHLVTFTCIWTALSLYTYSLIRPSFKPS
ncbi:MAG: EamA family transporter RarD [Spirochaetes bacterium]|nr:EamA family transporter RarD [Spirochaetota bacterium]